MDDTLFLWTARQIIERPWDFYGFQVNWDGALVAAPEMIKNPPIAAYYMALAGWFAGFSEKTLHLAFMFPAFMAVWGTYALARRMSSMPLLAAILVLATPAFLVSSTTLMCDVLMVAFWAWAAFFWIKGIEDGSHLSLALSGVLIALASLTKYFGISLFPLLAAYSLLNGRKGLSALPFLIIPAMALAGYNLYTQFLYGTGLLLDAFSYSAHIAGGAERLDRAIVGLVFAGGCVITALFFLPFVWGVKAIIPGVALIAGGVVYFVSRKSLGAVDLWTGTFGWGYAAQLAVYGATGAGIFLLVLVDFIRKRDAYSVFLGLWVVGTFAFTVFFNWTVNGRSILPMAPAVGILLARAVEDARPGRLRIMVPIALALAFSLLVAWADYSLAGSARDAAKTIAAKYASGPGQLWFQGHWGFQYYLESKGGKPLEWKDLRITAGDAVAFPFNNTGESRGRQFSVAEDFSYTPSPIVATVTLGPGAGFYAERWGPLPFMFFPSRDERYQVSSEITGRAKRKSHSGWRGFFYGCYWELFFTRPMIPSIEKGGIHIRTLSPCGRG
jgi:4-amino-4-deoxy-L-arabinose transferase-like glycosyltransferase